MYRKSGSVSEILNIRLSSATAGATTISRTIGTINQKKKTSRGLAGQIDRQTDSREAGKESTLLCSTEDEHLRQDACGRGWWNDEEPTAAEPVLEKERPGSL